MGFLDLFRRKPEIVEPAPRRYAPNPYLNLNPRQVRFFSGNEGRLLSGWDTTSSTIDYYLRQQLRPLRARSRKMVRANPYGKRFISTIKANVVGPNGVSVQAQVMRDASTLDTIANDAIEAAYADWAQDHCDFTGRYTWVDLQNMAIATAGQDGEFIFRKHRNSGKYGLQLECIDPELLNVDKNEIAKNGNVIRLGVEYDQNGRPVRYYFREVVDRNMALSSGYGYSSGKSYAIDAEYIIHGFIPEWPDQSRGAPWMHAALERSKHLDKYEEAAIVKARSTAATMAVIKSPPGDPAYEGDIEGTGDLDGVTLDQYEAGTIKDIGDRDIVNLDSDYPHEMYAAFVKTQLQGIASGLGISYHSLSNDLEGVNYSSIRAGVLEDREVFKGLQNWFIRTLIKPVYYEWVGMARSHQAIKIGNTPLSLNRPIDDYRKAHFQARRWAWVDPQKDGEANRMAIDYRLKSHSQIMREQGDDPETVWREIQRDQDMMRRLGIEPITDKPTMTEADSNG